uniref:Uncharacterized protein n=1 Tax=uncultured Desulfobacterium sp. TaxID=201089 RepID=E1YA96_9BACT|nr:unknown protein [uncultured Desulfobacterium sp.]
MFKRAGNGNKRKLQLFEKNHKLCFLLDKDNLLIINNKA